MRVHWFLHNRPLIGAAIFAAFFPLQAQELSIELNAEKSAVSYLVSDTLHTVHGDFRIKSGHVSIDPASNAIAGAIVVDAASGNSGSATRDKRMTHDILEAQKYAEIRFSPASVTGSIAAPGASNVQVTGSFLIHGQEHQITIPMQIHMSPDELTATGDFTVPYVQWGMRNPSNFLIKVNDKVQIHLNAVGSLKRTQ